MSTPLDQPPDDNILRAFELLRQLPPAHGPTAATLSGVQAAVRDAAARKPLPLWQRARAMGWTSKAATFVGLGAGALLVYVMLSNSAGTSIALAHVAEKLRAAETLVFDSAVIAVADGKKVFASRNYYTVPGKVRVEMRNDKDSGFVVFDFPAGKALAVSTSAKTATLSPIKGGAGHDMARAEIEYLRSLQAKPSRTLGEKRIDGVLAKGFEIDRPGQTVTLWADAQSGHPLRVELPQKGPEGPVVAVLTNFELDVKVDPEFFSVEPPKGFKVMPFLTIDFDATPADHVVNLLRLYAKFSNGEFPARLDAAVKSLVDKIGKPKADEPPSEELLQLSAYGAAVAAVTFSPKLKQGEDWQYYPGAKLGQKNRLVFWYRDRQSGAYRAVYGDLRVEPIERDRLPPAQ